METDVVVIGAGISGLTTAYYLAQAGLKVQVLESSHRVGGAIQSHLHEGYLLESGPNSFPNTGPAIRALCQALQIQPQEASAAAKKRYIYHNKQLKAVPESLMAFLTSNLLSPSAKLYLLGEPFRSSAPHIRAGDVSVAKLIRHRLGPEVLDRMVSPFLTGIYAGNPEVLSFPAVFPKLYQWLETSGSFVGGAFHALSKKRKNPNGTPKPKYALWNFPQGLEALPKALQNALPYGTVHTQYRVGALDWDPHRRVYHVHLDTVSLGPEGHHPTAPAHFQAKAVVLASKVSEVARLTEKRVPELAPILGHIHYVPLAVVQLGFRRETIPHDLEGFGFLVPRTEGIQTLGCIWNSSLFPNRAPEGHVLLTCFIGGALHQDVTHMSDEALIHQVLLDLSLIFKCPGTLGGHPPSMAKVFRYDEAIPQYHVGHQQRITQGLEILQRELPGLYLAGNYLHGISLNDCVAQAQQTATVAEAFIKGQRLNPVLTPSP